ncbi:MAG: VWA domain-containing protein [bacterium]
MKKAILQFVIYFIFYSATFANGVAIVNAVSAQYLQLTASDVNVNVDNQVGVITTTQTFKNATGHDVGIQYAFPLPEGASATQLKYYISGKWYLANIIAQPQDTTFPGGGDYHPSLVQYLGETPLYYTIDQIMKRDSTLIIELSYVQLLKYDFGNVFFAYPNDYTLIQSSAILQHFKFNLESERTIEGIELTSHTATGMANTGNTAYVEWMAESMPANKNYSVNYSLNLEQLGLFGFSTFIPDTLVPDHFGSGFFTFVAEPDPGETTEVIPKVFTLIIDRSGSMAGTKIVQARDAASFIVENLNEGDKFNIVDFSSDVSSFRTSHVEFNVTNKTAALNYIALMNANGSTNISGAFGTAIPQFSNTDTTTANIIIFFTDGEATAGLTNTNEILNYVNNLVTQNELTINLFTFGIGSSINEQLLTQLASQNNGLSQMLGNDELEEVITDFYLRIRNPVLLNTQITFSSDQISEVYPNPLPNLYKGQQMIVSGRFNQPGSVDITLKGQAFGNPVQYQYSLNLTGELVEKYQFLTKLWAKSKIEYLFVLYYSLDPNSDAAKEIKEEIISISLSYGVITEFTSFSGGGVSDVEEDINENEKLLPTDFKIIGNYPNPFNPTTTIRFSVGKEIHEPAVIKIFNSLGELIRTITIDINGKGIYEIYWDGLTESGTSAVSGIYVYVIEVDNLILASKMVMMK